MKKEFESFVKLYHYTNFEAACKIIVSETLLFFSLDRMNDVNESFRWIFNHSENSFLSWKDITPRFHQLSLSKDTASCPGFRILPMWGYYAQKGSGVCLVFDKYALLRCIEKDKAYSWPVRYKRYYISDIHLEGENLPPRDIRNLFFTKDMRWSFEQEFRILSHNKAYTRLHFADSLKYVILCSHSDSCIWNSCEYLTLVRLLGDSRKVLVYSSFLGEESLVYLNGSDAISVWERNNGENAPD